MHTSRQITGKENDMVMFLELLQTLYRMKSA